MLLTTRIKIRVGYLNVICLVSAYEGKGTHLPSTTYLQYKIRNTGWQSSGGWYPVYLRFNWDICYCCEATVALTNRYRADVVATKWTKSDIFEAFVLGINRRDNWVGFGDSSS